MRDIFLANSCSQQTFQPTQTWQNTYTYTQGSQSTWGISIGVSLTVG